MPTVLNAKSAGICLAPGLRPAIPVEGWSTATAESAVPG